MREKDPEVVGDLHDLPKIMLKLPCDFLEVIVTELHFSDAHPKSFVVQEIVVECLHHTLWHCGGAITKIMDGLGEVPL